MNLRSVTKEEEEKEGTMRVNTFDIFRGLVIVLMVLANTGIIQESNWNGLQLGDIIQPLFIFIIGLVVPYSLSKRMSEPKRKTVLHIVYRTFILFTLGFFLNNGYPVNLDNFRVMSVLQRLSFCYLFVALVYLLINPKWRTKVLIAVCISIVVLYSFSGTLSMNVDNLLLNGHMNNDTFDSEGLLSTVSAFSTCIVGCLVGQYFYEKKRLTNLVLLGGGLLLLGLVSSIWLPLNKQLWSSSFSLVVSGIGTLTILFFSLIQKYRVLSVFTVLGSNAIFIYVLNSLVNVQLMDGGQYDAMHSYLSSLVNSSFYGSVLYTTLYLFSLWIIALVLYKLNIHIKV